ncbi:MAGI3 [Cordylochernes scorpioides]|uniref:MAGI3 n=1 Tax=Cordylochernes scorpioides TaxID=51811 RepID=A0ABY6K917_9ARAC|nr:MAGI3 [Cordylochernes scorpioides]
MYPSKAAGCVVAELPEGWEKIDDPQYGTYYIESNRVVSAGQPASKVPYVFTHDPQELQGEMVHTVLVKSPRGFGFTIIGGENPVGQPEFLQIKSVVSGGPAWTDARLATGDVLVYVGDNCVLGSSHADVVRLFQAIPPGQAVGLTVCRGYPLPFDLDDPNNQVVTTSAIHESQPRYLGLNIKKGPNGFGFTIADSGHGQKVKKILDPSHCRQLQEGDVLVNIDGRNVQDMAHDDIVQLLKECSVGDSANVTVLRGPQRPASLSSTTVPPEYFPPGDFTDMMVTLARQENGFGFRIVGGTEEGSQFEAVPNMEADAFAADSNMSTDTAPPYPWSGTLAEVYQPGQLKSGFLKRSTPLLTMLLLVRDCLFVRVILLVSQLAFISEGRSPIRHLGTRPIAVCSAKVEGWAHICISHVVCRRLPSSGAPCVKQLCVVQVAIGNIVPGGSADLEGTLRTGDEILSIDNQCVVSTSHHFAVQLMSNAAQNGRVTLRVRRHFHSGDKVNMGFLTTTVSVADSGYTSKSNDSNLYPYDVTVQRQESEGFGFVIISSVSKAGSTIGRIIEGSPAERCGHLQVGDRILAVNGLSILNMPHGDIVNLIKESGLSATLTIGPPSISSVVPPCPGNGADTCSNHSEDGYIAVELPRGSRGLGFSIRGGRDVNNTPLSVLRIAEDGPAALDGRLRIGDRLVEINGMSTEGLTHAQAIDAIRQGGSTVRLLVHRPRLPHS